MNQKKLRAAVEAMLFAYAEPIGADKLAQALQMPVSSVEPVLEELRTRYAREDSGLCLLHLNTHWQLATKADFADPALGAAGPGGDGDTDRHRLQPAGLPRIH